MHATAPMWRNGRRNGLKIRWAIKARAGSSPAIGTSKIALSRVKFERGSAQNCEHWAEMINAGGDSTMRTIAALRVRGFDWYADALDQTRNHDVWEKYARETFLAHSKIYPCGKLQFLQYVSVKTRSWWKARENLGAILL